MYSSQSQVTLKPITQNLKPGLSANSLNSPKNSSKGKVRYSSYFNQLSQLTKKFERVQRESRKTYKKASENIKKNLKTLEDLQYSIEEDDGKWKENLQMFKVQRNIHSKVTHKLKALSFPEVVKEKEPIQRMKVKNELKIPEQSRVSVSEIYSNVGKIALMKNKRKFGQVRIKNESKSTSLGVKSTDRRSFVARNKDLRVLENVKNLTKLEKLGKEVSG